METRRVDVGELTLEVLEAGSGGRPLLLVHGFTGAKEDFADHIDGLAASGWHVVAPDQRGHGASDDPPGESSYSLAVYAQDLVRLLDALGWPSSVVLGHSMGGMVVQELALAAPARVRALVLMDTSHGPVEGIDPAAAELGRSVVREGGIRLLVELQRDRESPLDTPANQRLLRERPGWAEYGERNTLACCDDMWVAMSRELLEQTDRLDRLASSVRVPTLVIVGEQDTPFIADSERMAKAIPGARLEVIADAGHSPQFENPSAWWSVMTTFLQEVA
jgi:pimeloyl-ACP methyl ester carboxylesterase